MKFIIISVLVLVFLIYLLIISYKKRWNLKNYDDKDRFAKLATFEYYFWIIVVIIALVGLIFSKIFQFFE